MKEKQKLSEGKGIQKSEDLKQSEVVTIKELAKAKENQGIQFKGNSLTLKSAEVKPIETRKEVAKVVNVSHDTIAKVKVIQATATPEVKANLK